MDKLTVCVIKESGRDVGKVLLVLIIGIIGAGVLLGSMVMILLGVIYHPNIVFGTGILICVLIVLGLLYSLFLSWQEDVRQRCLKRYETVKEAEKDG